MNTDRSRSIPVSQPTLVHPPTLRPRPFALALLFLISLSISIAGTPRDCHAASIDVRHPDGRIEEVPVIEVGRAIYLSEDVVSLLYSSSKYWRPDLLKMTLRVGDHRLKLTADNRNVVIDERVVRLRDPVLYLDGRLLLPVQLVTDVMPFLVDAYPVVWNREEGLLAFGAPGVSIIETRVNRLVDGVEIVVRPSGPARYQTRENEDGSLFLRFAAARVADQELFYDTTDSSLRDLFWAMDGDTAVLHIVPSDSLKDYRVTREGRPERVVVRLSDTTLPPDGSESSFALDVLTRPSTTRRPIRRVIIDPGHGGSDPGCSGEGGLLEKDLTLALAERLATELKKNHSIGVVMTREEDLDLSLSARTEFANRNRGDLLISIHLNSSPVSGVAGTEVYVHSSGIGARDRIAAAVEDAQTRFEQEVVGGILDQDLRFVPWEAVQEGQKSGSGRVARRIQKELGSLDGFPARGVKEAPIAVLEGANMAAVLVEIGFLSSGESAGLLRREDVQDRIVRGLARAISGMSKEGS